MLKPIADWKALRKALKAVGKEVYLCEDCGNLWLASAKESPVRCSQRDCRAWANAPRYDSVGRPPSESEAD
jgi:hypothetical protein